MGVAVFAGIGIIFADQNAAVTRHADIVRRIERAACGRLIFQYQSPAASETRDEPPELPATGIDAAGGDEVHGAGVTAEDAFQAVETRPPFGKALREATAS